jgi:hypothetical protein
MNQKLIPSERMLAYCLGSLDEECRVQVEEELIESRAALMSYIAMKRSLDGFDADFKEPSAALKRRLLRDVEGSFGGRTEPARRWKPLVALAAGLLAVIGGVSLLEIERGLRPSRAVDVPPISGTAVDSANEAALSLNVL